MVESIGAPYEIIDAAFAGCVDTAAPVERLWTGGKWIEGPAWQAAEDRLIWSDIPRNRMLAWSAATGEVSTRQWQVFNATGPNAASIGPALALFGAGVNGITTPNDLFAPTNGMLTNAKSTNSVVGRLIGSWRVNDDINAYASVSRGRRPDALTFNVNPDGSYTKAVLPAETLWNYEIGVKSDLFDRRVRLNLAAFKMDYKDLQSQQLVLECLCLITSNAGTAPTTNRPRQPM